MQDKNVRNREYGKPRVYLNTWQCTGFVAWC